MWGFMFKQKIARFSAMFLGVLALGLLAGCSNGTLGSSTTTTTTPTGTVPVANIQMSGTPSTIFTDNSNSSTITVNATDASNASVQGATITLSTSSGQLSSSTIVTDATGKATATFSSGLGFANQMNRTASITATSGAATTTLPVQIVGSTVTLTSTTTSVPAGGGSPATLTITVNDKGGNPISGTAVTLTQTGGGTVTLTPTTGTTTNGQFVTTVTGGVAGAVTLSASAAGATATINYTVAPVNANFGISLLTLTSGGVTGTGFVPTNPKTTAMHIGDSLAVQVNAPAPTTSVIFATTMGTWNGTGNSVITVTPVAGIASATLTSATAGLASVQVLDAANSAISDTLTVGVTAKTAASIQLQASPTVVPKSVGSTVGYSNLNALVLDSTGAPVGGAPVAFSIVTGTSTGSGETVSPVVVFSTSTTSNGLALGSAPATFTSGSLSSGGGGVQIRASVVGTAIATQPIGVANATTSSNDVAIVVGGSAGSVAFGQATKIIDAGNTSTIYQFPMSVLVADSNGSPAPKGTVVNISTWPIAWSTGWGCSPDPDGQVWDVNANAYVTGDGGTFYNEDINQNLVLDSGEDGTRKYYANGTSAVPTGTSSTYQGLVYKAVASLPTKDGVITAVNSYGGTVASTNAADLPGTATTDSTGLATFNLTYTKSSANWIIARIRAQAVVQGSPAVGQLDWRLVASKADSVPCVLPPSPFTF